ncbi:MAG: hypothetical protein J0H98_03235 [Solirubrobacterales bacterium]|nr:hypothetical protein [Solirubrobacterales bacterium]
MEAPTYEIEPRIIDASMYDFTDPRMAICIVLTNGHRHFIREVDLDDLKRMIRDGTATFFHRHIQNEDIGMTYVGINCGQITTFYTVTTPDDVSATVGPF